MSIGFKEWALVCDALGRGDQSIILRKGGIHEGREGFRFKHDAFFLFPTLFHEQVTKTTLPPETPVPAPAPGTIEVRFFARAEWTALITDLAVVERLAPFHIWNETEIENRFRYENAGLSLAFVRIFRLSEPWCFPDAPGYGGCRSWVTLPNPPESMNLTTVLKDPAHQQSEAAIRRVLQASE